MGACHDVYSLSNDNHLYNRTRLNQSIDSLSRNRKKTTKFRWCEKKFELNVVQEKVIRVLHVKQDQYYILSEEIRAISRINKTASTLFRNQKTVPVGACQDVRSLSNEDRLYSRTRLNQSIESSYQNRKETMPSALFHKKFSKKSHLGIKNFTKFLFLTILFCP